MSAKNTNKKTQPSAEETSDEVIIENNEELKPLKPLKYYSKHSYPNGVMVNSVIIDLYAGQEIKTKRLVYELNRLGIPIVNNIDECY